MVWVNIPKPVGTNYTNINAQGKEQYDQASLTYDDSNTFYDGTNPDQWTNVAKPTIEFLATQALDYLMTEDEDYLLAGTENVWTNVAKPQ